MNEPNFCSNLFLTALRYWLLKKMLQNLESLQNYVIKTIFFQRHNKVRQKILYEHRIKIVSPRWASPPSRVSSPHISNPLIDFDNNANSKTDFLLISIYNQ